MTIGESSFPGQAEPSSESSGFTLTVTVYQADESTPRANAALKLTNINTGETITTTANAVGIATFTLSTDLTEGYEQDHAIKVEQVASHDDMEYYATGNGAATYPTWVQCSDSTRTPIKLNTARIKLDLTNYPAGTSIKITQTST